MQKRWLVSAKIYKWKNQKLDAKKVTRTSKLWQIFVQLVSGRLAPNLLAPSPRSINPQSEVDYPQTQVD